MIDPYTPILVGSGQVSDFDTPAAAGTSAIDMIERAARNAVADTGAGDGLLAALDSVCILRLYTDTSWRFQSPFGKCSNPPAAVAGRLGAARARLRANLALKARAAFASGTSGGRALELYRAPTGRGSEEEVGDEPPCVSLLVSV